LLKRSPFATQLAESPVLEMAFFESKSV